nr:hypothetical protein [uncultured Albidiferax sp.]
MVVIYGENRSFNNLFAGFPALEKLDGLKQRDDAMQARGQQPMGDVTNALKFSA